MGSVSDLPVLEKAMTTLDKFGVPYEVHVYSAHRTPVEAKEFAQQARANGFGAIIAAAGKAAHLACNRHSCKFLYRGRSGCTAFYCTDARRHSRCNSSH